MSHISFKFNGLNAIMVPCQFCDSIEEKSRIIVTVIDKSRIVRTSTPMQGLFV